MMTFDISSDHLSIIHDILRKNLPPNTKVWIFGSRLHKARKKYSDLDLLFDCQAKTLPELVLMNLREDFDESDLPYKVDIVDWNTITESFKENIQDKQLLLSI